METRKENEKLLFIDVDGTLSDDQGVIPATAKRAIHLARKAGHKVILCTGRTRGEITDDLIDMGIDGIVGSAGAFVEYNNQIIYHNPMKETLKNKLVDFFERNKTKYILQTMDFLNGNKESISHLKSLLKPIKDSEKFTKILNEVENPGVVDRVNKSLFFQADSTLDEIEKALGDDFTVLPTSIIVYSNNDTDISGEISVNGVNKATGMKEMLKFLGKDIEDTIAIGDGVNDVEMIEYAKIGIAMGNANQSLKKKADYVTTDINKNGIYSAFRHYNLI